LVNAKGKFLPGTVVKIEFTEPIDCQSLDIAWQFGDQVLKPSGPNILVSCDKSTLAVTPQQYLNYTKWAKTPTTSLNITGVKDLVGNEIAEPLIWKFGLFKINQQNAAVTIKKLFLENHTEASTPTQQQILAEIASLVEVKPEQFKFNTAEPTARGMHFSLTLHPTEKGKAPISLINTLYNTLESWQNRRASFLEIQANRERFPLLTKTKLLPNNFLVDLVPSDEDKKAYSLLQSSASQDKGHVAASYWQSNVYNWIIIVLLGYIIVRSHLKSK